MRPQPSTDGLPQYTLLRRPPPPPSNFGRNAAIAFAVLAIAGMLGWSGYHFREKLGIGVPAAASIAASQSNGASKPTSMQASPAPDAALSADVTAQADADAAATAAQASADAAAAAMRAQADADALLDAAATRSDAPREDPDDQSSYSANDDAVSNAALGVSLEAKRQLEGAVRQMLADGEACFADQQYSCALTNASNVLRLKPDDPAAMQLKTRTESAQADAMNSIDIH